MPADLLNETSNIYTVQRPACQSLPIIFSSPHSGQNYPQELLDQTSLKLRKLRSLEDPYVDELFGHVTELGAPLIKAEFPRAYLDLNREPFELDPKIIHPNLPTYANSESLRVKGGLGTIPRIVADGSAIYKKPILLADALARIKTYHAPYHAKLAELINATRDKFGFAILLDCHSMPSSSNIYKNKSMADIVLGNRHNSSCAPQITDTVATAFKSQGFSVQLNHPYAGGYITEHHGAPKSDIHAIQIEINRNLYMDQITYEKTQNFNTLKEKIKSIIFILAERYGDIEAIPFAAE